MANKKQKLYLFLFLLIILLISLLPQAKAEVVEVNKTLQVKQLLNSKPRLFPEIKDFLFYDTEIGKKEISKINTTLKILNDELNSNYTASALKTMEQEKLRITKLQDEHLSRLNIITTWENEYYYATKVWEYLMQYGYSEEVTAGIIGNMMIETIGMSLDLKPYVYGLNNEYFGLCQWALIYYPEADQLSFDAQLDYLLLDLPVQFKIFGELYKPGFTYKAFAALEDPAEIALAFATVYERCGSESYELRQQAAIKAYNYFKFD